MAHLMILRFANFIWISWNIGENNNVDGTPSGNLSVEGDAK